MAAVHARADWPGIRHLEAVVDYPVLRPDGTILSRQGYDPETGLLLETTGTFPTIPNHPTRSEVVTARDELLEVLSDFPFERDVHRAAWLAALLTPLSRFAFSGPAPLFLVDANVRAAGKGLLLDVILRIVTGERFTIAAYTSDEDELRKRITSLVLAGDRLVLFDNLVGKFGNAVLDAALTGTAWKDRLLGGNRMAEAPMYMTWYATGNNVAIAADTARRVCHVRLESPEERPEERQDFRHPDLLAWVGHNRARLLAAALTILRGYFAAGKPDQDLPAWGSFEGWSTMVRSAVVWVGLPDPGETRLLLQEQADVAAESMGVILACWEGLDPERRGLTAAEVIHHLYKEPLLTSTEVHADLRDALEALLAKPDSRSLGNRLRSYRRRVFQGRFIDHVSKEHHAVRWAVYPASQFRDRGKTLPRLPTLPSGPGSRGSQGSVSQANPRRRIINSELPRMPLQGVWGVKGVKWHQGLRRASYDARSHSRRGARRRRGAFGHARGQDSLALPSDHCPRSFAKGSSRTRPSCLPRCGDGIRPLPTLSWQSCGQKWSASTAKTSAVGFRHRWQTCWPTRLPSPRDTSPITRWKPVEDGTRWSC